MIATETRSDFFRWREAMGFDGKGSVKAGALIGLTKGRSIDLHSGKAEPTDTERLAMAAARLGMPPWSGDLDNAFAHAGEILHGIARADEIRELRQVQMIRLGRLSALK